MEFWDPKLRKAVRVLGEGQEVNHEDRVWVQINNPPQSSIAPPGRKLAQITRHRNCFTFGSNHGSRCFSQEIVCGPDGFLHAIFKEEPKRPFELELTNDCKVALETEIVDLKALKNRGEKDRIRAGL